MPIGGFGGVLGSGGVTIGSAEAAGAGAGPGTTTRGTSATGAGAGMAGFAVTTGAGGTGAGATAATPLGGAAGLDTDAAGAGSDWVNALNATPPTTANDATATKAARPLTTHPAFHVDDGELAGGGTGSAWGTNVICGRWTVGAFGET
jgi:hypothetical protein